MSDHPSAPYRDDLTRSAPFELLRADGDQEGDGLTIDGFKTTVALHKALAQSADVRANATHTQYLEPWLEANPIPS